MDKIEVSNCPTCGAFPAQNLGGGEWRHVRPSTDNKAPTLREVADAIVRDAVAATESGQTCFVPRYQVDAMKAALTATPSAQAGEFMPCPFCGNDVARDEGCFPTNRSMTAWEVRCGNPNCFAHDAAGESRADAINRWNRRATPQPQGDASPEVSGGGDDAPAAPWKTIDLLPNSDDLFWFLRGDTIDGPRSPQFGGYDSDEWDYFAPAEAPPTTPRAHEPARPDRDAYEGAREDLLDWKGRAQRAEARLRSLGWKGIDASEPAPTVDGGAVQPFCRECGTRSVRHNPITIDICARCLQRGDPDPIGWVFQHDETGRMTFCENDGINTPEVFTRLNPRHTLCGPAHRHPAPAPDVARTLYDGRTRIQQAVERAAGSLYVALKNLLAAVEERDLQRSVESSTLADARNALTAAQPKEEG